MRKYLVTQDWFTTGDGNATPWASKNCPGCDGEFKAGQYVTLMSVGPGDDEIEREHAREGLPYTGVAIPVHWACATGELDQQVDEQIVRSLLLEVEDDPS